MIELTTRLSWVLAAPFLAVAGLAAATYTAAVWAAETVADFDDEGGDQP